MKQSMSKTYMPRVTAAGARVLTGTRVDRVLLRRGRVTGAVATTASGALTISAGHVWVCGGAIATPALLQRSGAGRGAGRTLSMHPTVKLVARFDAPLDAARDVPVHQIKEFAPDLSFGGSASRRGYWRWHWLRTGPTTGRCSTSTPSSSRSTTRRSARAGRPGACVRCQGFAIRWSPSGSGEPICALLACGLRRLAHLLFAAGARSLSTPPCPERGHSWRLTTSRHCPPLCRATKLMTVHLCSSVPMGERRDRCPADSYGRVRGVGGLRVNDASLLPSAPGINPQGTIMAIAARNCAQFLAEGR